MMINISLTFHRLTVCPLSEDVNQNSYERPDFVINPDFKLPCKHDGWLIKLLIGYHKTGS